jgi:hypothetical protein
MGMITKQRLVVLMVTLLVAGSYADVLEDWQFDDANNTQLNVVNNSGTTGTAFNFGGPRTQNGSLNIGDANFFKYDVGTGSTFRSASFSDITSGQVTFEFIIADWYLGGSEGEVGNGIGFTFGDTQDGAARIDFEVTQSPGNDIRVRSQSSNNGSLSGTDAQNQLGGLNLTNANSVTVQLIADLDTGVWSTRVDAGSDGSFVDLVTDGTGMLSVDRIQLVMDGGANGWEYNGTSGVAADYIKVDSVTLTHVIPEPATLGLVAGFGGFILFIRRRFMM